MGLLEGLLGAVLGGQAVPQQGSRGSDDLGGLLPGLVRGQGGANLVTALLPVVLALLQSRGGAGAGLGGLLQQFQQHGLGRQVDSWVGTGANMALRPDDVIDVLGHDRVAAIAAQAGVSEAEAGQGLSALLPELVNQLSPAGHMPAERDIDDALGDLQRSLGV